MLRAQVDLKTCPCREKPKLEDPAFDWEFSEAIPES
jgi:hypothetical protein